MRGGTLLKRRTIIYFSILFLAAYTFILSSGCSSKPSSTKIEERNGLLYIIGEDDLFTGKIVDTLTNRIISYEVLGGKKNGEFKISSTDGVVLMVGKIKNNLNEGQWCYYYPDGKMESLGNFSNNLLEGKWTWYFENGRIKEIGYYKAGKRDGAWVIFDEKGNIKRKSFFKEDQMTYDMKFDKEIFS